MTVKTIADVQFGEALPEFQPDTSLENVRRFTRAARLDALRFTDHDAARREGLAGAILPGMMSQAFLAAMIHRWAPEATIEHVDTVFRAPVLVDEPHRISGVVTDIDEAAGTVEIDLTVTNAAAETRVFGTASVRIPV